MSHDNNKPERPRILVLLGAFWPGHDATGPNQSFRQMALALQDEFEFLVVARDRPFGAAQPLVATNRWFDEDFASFRYCRVAKGRGAVGLGEVLRHTSHDLLMMNGFFDREFTIPALFMRKLAHIPQRPCVVSTRGEFAGGALGLKNVRKRAFLELGRRLGLHKDVWLHATWPIEAQDISKAYPYARDVLVAPNIRRLDPPEMTPRRPAQQERLRLAFLGRIARVKNIDVALRALQHVNAPLEFVLYGPVQEADYWRECQDIIAQLPAHIEVVRKGEIKNADVPGALREADLFFMPTKGENFGHAILDALVVGTPVLISDQTPFADLQHKGAGWDLPLDNERAYSAAIDQYGAMNEERRARLRAGARRLAEQTIEQSDAVELNRKMLCDLLTAKRKGEAGGNS